MKLSLMVMKTNEIIRDSHVNNVGDDVPNVAKASTTMILNILAE